jgi:FtsH-binding integral membrane protein
MRTWYASFKYGYKKKIEMATYIMSILFNVVDIIIVLFNIEFFGELGVVSFVFSFISIILFVVAIIACAIDKRK